MSGGHGHRDGFDLHELIGPAEHGDAEQRARRIVITESRADDLPDRGQVGPFSRGDEHGGLKHVSQRGAGLGQGGDEVGHGQAGLRPNVSDTDHFTLVVQRTCSGGEDQGTTRGNGRVRVGSICIQAVRMD